MLLDRKKIIVVVDDNAMNLNICKNILKLLYEVYPVSSAAKMFMLMERIIPDLILLDVELPEMNGYEAMRILKTNNKFKDVPFIFISGNRDVENEMKGLNLGALDYIFKPIAGELLLRRIETHLSLIEHKKELNELNMLMHKMVVEKTEQVWNLQNAVLNIIADLVEFRDEATGGHISKIKKYLCCLIVEMIEQGVYADEIYGWNLNFVLPSAQLHDVGKIGVSDSVLNKPAKLTPAEYEIIKTHVEIGVNAIGRMENLTGDHSFFRHAKAFAGMHHEKWDGTGYPNGLAATGILLEGRLMAIVDVYDALISVRPYKQAFTHSRAAEIIKEGRGKHFDPYLVDIFDMVSDQFENIDKETCILM